MLLYRHDSCEQICSKVGMCHKYSNHSSQHKEQKCKVISFNPYIYLHIFLFVADVSIAADLK